MKETPIILAKEFQNFLCFIGIATNSRKKLISDKIIFFKNSKKG